MRSTILILAAALAVHASAAEPPAKPGPDFTWRLFGAVPAQGNVFVSPESVRLALAMAAAGARGETEAELRAALGMPPGDAGLAQTAAQLERWGAVARAGAPAGGAAPLQLQVANRAWAQAGRSLDAAYVALLRDAFRSKVGRLDFKRDPGSARDEINRWVSDRTAGKIPALLAPGAVTVDTRLVLTNAIHLKATWAREFEREWTKDASFFVTAGKKVQAPLMNQVARFGIAAIAEGGQILELPYLGGELAMDVILPARGRSLSELERALGAGALSSWTAKLSVELVDVTLPRWRSSTSAELSDALRRLGIAKAFAAGAADFSGIDGTHELTLSAVVHQAAVEVAERGTEAVAATVPPMPAAAAAPGGEPTKPVIFRADHPFLYVIRDTRTGAVLFVGRLVDPTAP
jgi:serpin B